MDTKEKAQGRKAVDLLRRLSRDIFGIDIDQVALERNHEFWALGIDSQKKRYVDLPKSSVGNS